MRRQVVAVAPKVAAIVNLSLKVAKKLMGLKDKKKKQLDTFVKLQHVASGHPLVEVACLAGRMLGEGEKLCKQAAKSQGEWGKGDLKSLVAYTALCRSLHCSWPLPTKTSYRHAESGMEHWVA